MSKNEYDYKSLLGSADPFKSHGKDVDWFPRDTKEVFLKTPQEHQDYWNANPFTYSLNDWGHRCEDIDVSANNILFLGCSNTFGTGLPKEKTWPYLVSKELGMREVNLGLPGGSLDSCFRLYNAWQYEIKAPITVLCKPPGRRVEIDRDIRYALYGAWSKGMNFKKDVDDFILRYMFGGKAYNTIEKRNIAAIKWIAHETNSKLFILDFPALLEKEYKKTGKHWRKCFPLARDGAHPGPSANEWFAKEVLKCLEE